jgi:hypothetical protein
VTTGSKTIESIKESFDPKLVSALYKNFSDKYVALLELIDNAVDDKADGRELMVEITLADSSLTIKNHDGRGMGLSELEKFFKWGVSNKQRRIGRYGQGGKAALGYLGKGFSIKTHPANQTEAYLLDVENWQDRSDGFKEVQVEPYKFSSDEGSVEIRVKGLQKSFNKETLTKRIAETYRPLILDEQVMFFVDGDAVECSPANFDPGTEQSFKLPFTLDEEKYHIHGKYGIVSDANSPRGGFNIYQFGRLVAKNEYFGHRDPSKKWNLERVYGELHLDFEVPLLMNKTDADRDSAVWQKITKLMHDEIESTIRTAAEYQKPTKKETKPVKKIDEKLKRAEGKKFGIDLANYGPSLLFKVRKDSDGSVKLLVNREHKAYERWSETAEGRRLYTVMIYSLYTVVEELPKKQAADLTSRFSKSLNENTHKLL